LNRPLVVTRLGSDACGEGEGEGADQCSGSDNPSHSSDHEGSPFEARGIHFGNHASNAIIDIFQTPASIGIVQVKCPTAGAGESYCFETLVSRERLLKSRFPE